MAVKVKTLKEFIDWADRFKDGQYLFRGVSNKCYPIEESTYRRFYLLEDGGEGFHDVLQVNLALISDTRHQRQDQKNGRQLTDLELLAELQHLGAATCLVDFTRSALVALWFACRESSTGKEKSGKVVVLQTDGIAPLKTVNDQTLDRSLDYFFELDSALSYPLYQWHPSFLNNRIIAQQSVFVFGNPPIEEDAKCIVVGCSKRNILRDLEKLAGITETSLFPDFEGISRVNAHNKPTDANNARVYRQRGIDAYYDSKWDEAINWLTKAIDSEPDNLHAHVYLGRVYYNKGRHKSELADIEFEDAIKCYTESIRLAESIKSDPKRALSKREHAMLYVYRGRAYYNKSKVCSDKDDKLDLAIEDCQYAIGLDPKCADAYNMLGVAYCAKQEYQKAIERFDKAIMEQRRGEPRYRCNRGEALLHLKEWQRALEDLKFAKNRRFNITASFCNEYDSIEDFESEIGDDVPKEVKRELQRLLTLSSTHPSA